MGPLAVPSPVGQKDIFPIIQSIISSVMVNRATIISQKLYHLMVHGVGGYLISDLFLLHSPLYPSKSCMERIL